MSFLAKLALAKVKLRGVDKAGRTDEKLGEIIRNFSYDEKEVATKRRQASRSFHNTLRLINRVDGRQISLSDEKLELKQYLSLVKKQIMDIVKVVSLIKSLVEDEDLQLLYDVRAALSVLEDFVNALKKNVRGLKVPRETKNKLESIAKEIDHSFEKLLTDVQAMVSKIYQYLRSTGFKTEASPTQEIDLGTFVRDRTRLKRQVNGKVQYIRFKIKELITQLNEIKKSSEDKDKISSLVTVLAYFNKQFTGLVEFSLSRGEMSTQVVLSSITMQKKYLKELDELKVELEKFEELIGQTKNEKQKAKLKNDYVLLQGEIDDIQDELKDIADTEKEEKKYIRLEARYGRRVKRGIGKIARGIAAGVALTVIGCMASGQVAQQASMKQTIKQGYHQQMEEYRLDEHNKQIRLMKKEFSKAGVILPDEVKPKSSEEVIKKKKVAKEKEKKVEGPSLLPGELTSLELEQLSKNVVALVKAGHYKKVWAEFFPSENRIVLFGKNKLTGKTDALFVYWAKGGLPKKRVKKDSSGRTIDVFVPTPKGTYTLGKNEFKAKHGWSKWPGARVPYGADLREAKTAYEYEYKGKTMQFVDVDIQAEYKGKWRYLTSDSAEGKRGAGSKGSLWIPDKKSRGKLPQVSADTHVVIDPATGKAIGGTKSFIDADGTPKEGAERYFVKLPEKKRGTMTFVEITDPETGTPQRYKGGLYSVKVFHKKGGNWFKPVFRNSKFYDDVNGKYQLNDYYLANVYGRGVYHLTGAVFFHSTTELERLIYKKYKNGWIPSSVLDEEGGGYSHGCVHAGPGFMEMVQALKMNVKIKVHGGKTRIAGVFDKYGVSATAMGLAKKSKTGWVLTKSFANAIGSSLMGLASGKSKKSPGA